MKITKTETETVENVVATVCDMCGARKDKDTPWPEPENERLPQLTDDVDVIESSGRLTARWSRAMPWGDGVGFARSVSVDLCPRCVVDRLLPVIRAQFGTLFDIKKEEW